MKRLLAFFKHIPRGDWGIAALTVLLASGIGYVEWSSQQKIDALQKELDFTSRILEEAISETHASLAEELNKERGNLSAVQNELGNFRNVVVQEVGSLSSSVTTLEKLSETDPELLKKYSKVYFLSEHYAPPKLAAIDPNFLYYETRPESVHIDVWPHLRDLLNAANLAGVKLYVVSAYRSFDEQASLKNAYTVTYGSGSNTFSADQGYSEHQLGSTVDFITTGIGGKLEGFEGTFAYQWLLSNAHRYGFVLSYPKGNAYYVFEPWHWRYVGVELATKLKNDLKNFYDVDQREIDEYLIKLFE
ncbi:MAG: M15 family metallopeptidase [Patescibacteria group bacterium]